LWRLKLDDLKTFVTKTDVSQAVYTQLTAKGLLDDDTSANKWSVFVGSTLPIFEATLVPDKIQIYSVSSLTTTNFSTAVEECTESGPVAALLDFGSLDADVTCNGKTWRLGDCSDISGSPSYCVGCSGQCDSSCSVNSHGLFPTGSSCDYAAQGMDLYDVNFIRAMVVTFRPPAPAPGVTSMAVSSIQTTSIDVAVNLEADGLVYVVAMDVASGAVFSITDVVQGALLGITSGATVSLSVPNLVASKAYQLVAFVISVEGVSASEAVFDAQYTTAISGSTFSTACCRDVAVAVNFNQLAIDTQLADAVTVVIDAMPVGSEVLTLAFSTTTGGIATTDSADYFFPSSCSFSASSSSTTCILQFAGSPLVSEQVVVAAATFVDSSGASVTAPYNVTFSTDAVVTFTTDAVAPKAPVLLSCTFDSNPLYVRCVFDVPTEHVFSSTGCPELLINTDADVSISHCHWASSTELLIISVNMPVGYVVQFKPEVRAECVAPFELAGTCGNFELYNHSTNAVVTVAAPLNPLVPNVVLTGPNTIGSCTDLILSFGLSTNNGGRSWKSSVFTVDATNATQAQIIEDYLNTNSFSTEVDIPGFDDIASGRSSMIPPGFAYHFQVKLCNFLDSCAVASISVTVLADVLPTVMILGDPVREGKRKDTLRVRSKVYTPDCTGFRSTNGLAYIWEVYTGEAGFAPLASNLVAVTSVSVDPTVLILPEFSLEVQSYVVVLSVVNTATQASSSAQISINIKKGDLYAWFGDAFTVGGSSARNFSAVHSRDDDYDPALGLPNPNLAYAWSCVQTSPSFSTSCPGLTFPADMTTRDIEVSGAASSTARMSTVSLMVTSGTRTVITSANIETFASDVAFITIITASLSDDPYNPTKVMIIEAEIDFFEDVTFEWTCSKPEINMTSRSLAMVSGPLSIASGLTDATSNNQYDKPYKTFPVNLVMRANTFPVVSDEITFTLTIRLQADATLLSSAVVKRYTIAPPSTFGELVVSPTSGTSLETTFSLSADLWYTEAPPLSYSYGVFTNFNSYIQLIEASESPFVDIDAVPAGTYSLDNNLTMRATVCDRHGLCAHIDSVIQVHPPSISSPLAVRDLTSLKLSLAGNANSFTPIISAISSLLNIVSCTGAPDCAALGREDCSSTTDTCGECLIGQLGASGDSNSACFYFPFSRKLVETLPMECNNNCSAAGACSYVNIDNGASMSSCTSSDANCLPVCSCNTGFYGTLCGYDEGNLTVTYDTRVQLLESLYTTVQTQNVDNANVNAWIAMLNSNTQLPEQLNVNSTVFAFQTAKHIVDSLPSTTLSATEAASVLNAINKLSFWMTGYVNPLPYASTTALMDELVSYRAAILDGYGSYISSSLVVGQAGVSSVLSEIRVMSSVHDISTGVPSEVTNVSLVTTTNGLEVLASYGLHTVVLPVTNDNTNTDVLRTSEVVTRAKPFFNSTFDSDPLRLNVLAYPCAYDGSAACDIRMTLTHHRDVPVSATDQAETGATHLTACATGNTDTVQLICDATHNVTATCTGQAGVVHTRCPNYRYTAKCATLDGVSVGAETCTTTSYTATETSCICSLAGAATSNADPVFREYAVALGEHEEGFQQDFVATTGVPSGQPSGQPTSSPTNQPSGQPTSQPTIPTGQPTGQPTSQPTDAIVGSLGSDGTSIIGALIALACVMLLYLAWMVHHSHRPSREAQYESELKSLQILRTLDVDIEMAGDDKGVEKGEGGAREVALMPLEDASVLLGDK